MKILRLRTYFYPENVAASAMNEDFENELVRRKIFSVNYTPVPSRGISDEIRKEYRKKKYEEFKGGYVTVYRFPMIKEGTNFIQRTIKFLLCNVVEYFKGCGAKDIDLVFGGSTPPTQGLLCGMVAKNSAKNTEKKYPSFLIFRIFFPIP